MLKQIFYKYLQLLTSTEYGQVVKNFGFLTILQIGNYLLPLLALPYLLNVLGAEIFGLVMFGQAFSQYFIILIDNGFNFSATKEIAINRNDTAKVSEIFWTILTLKFFLFLLSLFSLIILVFTVDKFSATPSLYFLSFALVIGNVLFPMWFFQGLEQMKYITFVNLTSKLVSTLAIFLFIHKADHFLLVPLIYAVSSIVPSIVALSNVKKIFALQFVKPTWVGLKDQLVKAWFIFLSSVSSSLYGVSNTFLLGLLFNNTFVGYYAFGEKIIRACTSLFIPLNNALYPYMSVKIRQSPAHGRRILRNLFYGLAIVTLFGSILMYFGSGVLRIIDESFSPSILILKILSPLILLVGVSNFIGYQILLTTDMERKYLQTVFLAGLLNVVIFFIISPYFLYESAAFCLLISEMFVCFSFLFFSRKILFYKP